MLEVHPNITNVYTCPRCSGPLTLSDFIISGVHNRVDATCERCERGYYIDMPAGSGFYYPATLDRAMADKHIGGAHIEVEQFTDRSEIVLVNCLDGCYGDCLHKLFNTQYYLDHCPHLGAVVLIPKQIRCFVPDGVAEIWTVNLPIPDYWHWNAALARQVGDLVRKKKKAFLAITYPHPHPTYYDLDRFARAGATDLSGLGSPVVTFGYREDRLWGGSLSVQRQNIQQLYGHIKRVFPEMSFVVIGFGVDGQFDEGILDKRTKKSTPELEQCWIDLLNRTDCFIGVHGSNMILGSGLAKYTIELLSEDRYGNFGQSYLVRPDEGDWRINLFRFRTIHGDNHLSDIAPRRVAAVASSQLGKGETYGIMMGLDHQPRQATPDLISRLREKNQAAWGRWRTYWERR